jgi:hypothetical protein
MMKSTDIEAGEKMAELNGYFNGTSDPFRVYGWNFLGGLQGRSHQSWTESRRLSSSATSQIFTASNLPANIGPVTLPRQLCTRLVVQLAFLMTNLIQNV